MTETTHEGSPRRSRGIAGEATPDTVKTTTCYMCACRCGVRVTVRNGRVVHVEGNPDHPVNKGVLCGKGAAAVMQQASPARLRKPLKRVGERNRVAVNMTITTLDRDLARALEPRAPRPDLRLKAVEAVAKGGIPVGVLPNPIMPGITDDERRLDRLGKAAKDHGASYFGGGVLFLMPCAKRVFFPFVAEKFPHLLRRYEERYRREAYLKGPYREVIGNRIAAIRDRYGLNSGPPNREIAAMDAAFVDAASEDAAQGLLFTR